HKSEDSNPKLEAPVAESVSGDATPTVDSSDKSLEQPAAISAPVAAPSPSKPKESAPAQPEFECQWNNCQVYVCLLVSCRNVNPILIGNLHGLPTCFSTSTQTTS